MRIAFFLIFSCLWMRAYAQSITVTTSTNGVLKTPLSITIGTTNVIGAIAGKQPLDSTLTTLSGLPFTGTGRIVLHTAPLLISPTFTTPVLGDATATSVAIGTTNVIGALAGKQPSLGYTPVNQAGDTMTGQLALPIVSMTSIAMTGTSPTFNGSLYSSGSITLTNNTTITLTNLAAATGYRKDYELIVIGNGSSTLTFAGASFTADNTIISTPRNGVRTHYAFTANGSAVNEYNFDDTVPAYTITGLSGAMINSGTPSATAIPQYSDTTGTNISPTKVLVDSSGNVTGVNSIIVTNNISVAGITNNALTASRALVSGTDKTVQSSATTATELGYVSGVTSAIQTQLNGKQASLGYTPVNQAGDTMSGSLLIGTTNVIGAIAGKVDGPASSTDTAIARFSGTGGKTLQNSVVTVDGSGNMSGLNNVTLGASGTLSTPTATIGALTVTNSMTFSAMNVGTLTVTNNISGGGSILSQSATGGIGYKTGAGGAVTQTTSRTTGVTLNTVSGAITLVSAAGTTTPATFTVTNSAVAATDTINWAVKTGSANLYEIHTTAVAAGSFNCSFWAFSGTATEAPVFNFNVIKGSAN